jgi:hypothetical protein
MSESGESAVEAQVGRLRIVDESGATLNVLDSEATTAVTAVPAGPEGRTLVLAERSAPGWEATLNGQRLEPASTGWYQAYELPAAGGDLEVRYVTAWEPWSGIAQVIVFALTILLAVPVPARPRFVHVPQGRARTAAHPVSTGRRTAVAEEEQAPVAVTSAVADREGAGTSDSGAESSDHRAPAPESVLSSGRAGT